MTRQSSQRFECPNCGGTFFSTEEFSQYLDMYSAAPGGELHATGQKIAVRICLCGHLVKSYAPRRRNEQEEEASFRDSAERAQRRRADIDAGSIQAKLQTAFASRRDYQAAIDEIQRLREIIERHLQADSA